MAYGAEIDPQAPKKMNSTITNTLSEFRTKFTNPTNGINKFAADLKECWGGPKAQEFAGKLKIAMDDVEKYYNGELKNKIEALNTNIGNHEQANDASYGRIEFNPLNLESGVLEQVSDVNGHGKHGLYEGKSLQNDIYNPFANAWKNSLETIDQLPGDIQKIDPFGDNETAAVISAFNTLVGKLEKYYEEIHSSIQTATGTTDTNYANLYDTNTDNANG